jgi:hypothetical protein
MSIGTNDLVDKFGTQDQVDDGSTSAIASAAMSVAADAATWTNDDDAPEAVFALKCQWATVTNVANKVVNLYAKPLNIQSTNDPVDPSTSRKATLIGKFTVYAASTGTDYWFNSDDVCPLPNFHTSQEYEFYIENLTGQQISAGWALYITPKTVGPKA